MKKQNHLKNSLLFLSLILMACGQQTDSGKQTQKKQLEPFASTYSQWIPQQHFLLTQLF